MSEYKPVRLVRPEELIAEAVKATRKGLRDVQRPTGTEKARTTEVAQEASARATKKIQADEVKLVQFFKDKGLTITEIDKADFLANVQKNVTFEQFGYRKADWERIQAIK